MRKKPQKINCERAEDTYFLPSPPHIVANPSIPTGDSLQKKTVQTDKTST